MFPEEGNEKNRVLLVSVITINGQGRVEEGVRRSIRPRLQICVQEQRIMGAKSIKDIFLGHHLRYLGHVCRDENTAITKKMMFTDSQASNYSDPWDKVAESLGMNRTQLLHDTWDRAAFKRFTRSLMDPLQQ